MHSHRTLGATVVISICALLCCGCGADENPPSDSGVDLSTTDGMIPDSSAADAVGDTGPAGAPRTASDPAIGGGSQCDLVALAKQIATEENSVLPANCGVAILADPMPVWEAINDCLVYHLNERNAFFGVFQLQSDEVNRLGFAIIGSQGPPFVFKQIIWDSDPYSGWQPNTDPRAEIFECQDYGVAEDCAPTQGFVCMGCFDTTRDVSDLCPGWPKPF